LWIVVDAVLCDGRVRFGASRLRVDPHFVDYVADTIGELGVLADVHALSFDGFADSDG
jgi:hypothetical protein